MKILLEKVIISTIVFYLAAYGSASFTLHRPVAAVAAALLFGLLSLTVRPLLLLIALPLSLLSFGLFILVIDAWLLQLVDLMLGGFHISGFGTALVIVFLIMILNLVVRRAMRLTDADLPGSYTAHGNKA